MISKFWKIIRPASFPQQLKQELSLEHRANKNYLKGKQVK